MSQEYVTKELFESNMEHLKEKITMLDSNTKDFANNVNKVNINQEIIATKIDNLSGKLNDFMQHEYKPIKNIVTSNNHSIIRFKNNQKWIYSGVVLTFSIISALLKFL